MRPEVVFVPLLFAGIPVVLFLFCLFLNSYGEHCFGDDVVKSFLGLPLVTRRKFRENNLLTVREKYPYVGDRWAYVEHRRAVYCLFGWLPVYMLSHNVELPTNTMSRVMCLGDSINGLELDKSFPPILHLGVEWLGKGSPMLMNRALNGEGLTRF